MDGKTASKGRDYVDQILSTGMDYNSYLEHYGVGHKDGGHSGRWPYGSGERPYQRDPQMQKTIERFGKEAAKQFVSAQNTTVDVAKAVRRGVTKAAKATADTARKLAKNHEENKQKRAEEKAKREAEVKEQQRKAREDFKAKLIAEGDINQILDNKSMFTDQELNQALARANTLAGLKTRATPVEKKPTKQDIKNSKLEQQKQELIRSGDIEKILENQSILTTSELAEALNRANSIAGLNAKVPKKKTLGDKVTDVGNGLAGGVATMTKWVGVGINAYNTVKKVQSIVNGDTKVSLGKKYADQIFENLKDVDLDKVDYGQIKNYATLVTSALKIDSARNGKKQEEKS